LRVADSADAVTDRKPGIVLFLGSGFSAVLGIPTTTQVNKRLLCPVKSVDRLQIIEDAIGNKLAQYWRTVFGWEEGKRGPSLEDHFTQLDMAANTGHQLGSVYQPKQLRAIRRWSIHRIFTLLKSQESRSECVTQVLSALDQAFGVTVVTTNWDTEAESCIYDGIDAINYGLDVITDGKRQSPPDGTQVLKLHGCVNKGYCDCCKALISFGSQENVVVNQRLLLEPEDFTALGEAEAADILRRDKCFQQIRQCLGCGGRITARVATFSYRKDLNPHAFYTIWDKAYTSLQLASNWIFVGYSLPEADTEIRHLLKSAQVSRKNVKDLSIDVVLKGDCQAGERYERFFGLPDERIFQGGLEDWAVERAGNYCGSVKPSIAAGTSSEERAT